MYRIPAIRPLVRGILLVAVVAVLAACSDDRPRRYLQSQPEDTMAFPGAELTCTRSRDTVGDLRSTEPARSEHCYTAKATEDEVVAWYAEELASRGWARMGERLTTLPLVPDWDKGFVNLHIRDFQPVPGGQANGVTYTVVTEARSTGYEVGPISRLESLPETALVVPESTDPNQTTYARTTNFDGVVPASVETSYRSPASVDDVVGFYEAELAERDWLPVDLGEVHNGVGTLPNRAWKKGDVAAHVTAYAMPPGAPFRTGYRFRVIEVLGPELTPGFPWQ